MRGRLLRSQLYAAAGAALVSATLLKVGALSASARAQHVRFSFRPPSAPGHNPWRSARRALAPAGPIEIGLCRYAYRQNRQQGDGDQLVGHGSATGATAAGLVDAFDALRAAKRPGSFKSCVFDDAPVVAYLEYAGGRSVAIYVVTSNCWSATNGDVTRSAGQAAWRELRNQLQHLTPG